MDPKNYNTIYGECRCCLTKGHHKDIMKEYYWNGSREVYYDIFMECFNLFLSTNTNLSTLICSPCVQKLRDANSFRTMVASTEQKLLQTLNDDQTVFVNVGAHTLDSDIKLEDVIEVKEELTDLEENEVMDYDNDPDYLPSDEHCDNENVEMLTEETQNDIIQGEADLLARFPRGSLLKLPTRSTLYTSCTDFVMHLDSLKGKLITPKMIANLFHATEHRRAVYNSKKVYVTEKMAHIVNASTLLEFSNVTPFKSKSRSGFPCFYCRNIFENLSKLREHQNNEHASADIKRILSTYGVECFVVYVDVSELECSICKENLSNLNELKSHLTKLHKKKMHTEFTDRVIPFKLSENNVYECQVCGFSFETFGSIERHMNVHYRNYVCKECGSGFVTKYRLKVHTKSMHIEGNFPCEICKKIYTSQQKYKNHVDTVHKLVKRFKCPKCPERFSEYFRRQKHMVQTHGVAPLQYRCNVCEKSFDRRYTLSRHMKRDHLEERDFQCDICTYKCFTNNELRVHMVKHNGERIFECSVCKKSYARKKTLKEHMRIHNNDRRFACAVCGQAFVQKCSLKGHIKTHHLEYSLQ